MKHENNTQKKGERKKKFQLYKPRRKKNVEEDAAIQYLKAQYDKVELLLLLRLRNFAYLILYILTILIVIHYEGLV